MNTRKELNTRQLEALCRVYQLLISLSNEDKKTSADSDTADEKQNDDGVEGSDD